MIETTWEKVKRVFGSKTTAIITISLMIFADFLAMCNLFTQLHASDALFLFGHEFEIISEVQIYALTMVALLEGTPCFLGMTASVIADKGVYRHNDKANALVGAIASGLGLLGSWGLVIALRVLVINQNGGYAAYLAGEYPDFVLHVCLSVTPILTSILAGVASWTVFRKEQETELARDIEKQYRRFLYAQKEFLASLCKNEDAKVALWSSLTTRPNGPMPQDFDSFRQECFTRIRAKLIENCITQYPDQIQRFNAAVEDCLKYCIGEMSKYSTIPDEIRGIDLEKLIAKYDFAQKVENTPGGAWNYAIAGDILEIELKTLLDNAVVTAQFKTSYKPRHMEGEVYP